MRHPRWHCMTATPCCVGDISLSMQHEIRHWSGQLYTHTTCKYFVLHRHCETKLDLFVSWLLWFVCTYKYIWLVHKFLILLLICLQTLCLSRGLAAIYSSFCNQYYVSCVTLFACAILSIIVFMVTCLQVLWPQPPFVLLELAVPGNYSIPVRE